MPSFTGSYAYGEPDKESDIDLVVRVTGATESRLRRLLGCMDGTVRSGKINLILYDDDTSFAVWKTGTESLKRRAARGVKSDKKAAKEILDSLREQVGILDEGQSGPK